MDIAELTLFFFIFVVGRKVSVMDVSKKYGIEYRMLHAIMKGHPWYGDWGYKFGSGSYCLTHEAYKSAVESLSNLPLSSFSHGRMPNSRVEDMIKYYQSLSEHELVNIRDLFCFIMGLIGDAHKTASNVDETTCKKRCFNASGLSMSWDKSGIERVEQALIRVLRAVSESKWVSWRALRGAASKLGSPELLDYCLGELGGKMVYGGMVVNSQCNPQTGVYEFRLDFNLIIITACLEVWMFFSKHCSRFSSDGYFEPRELFFAKIP